MSILQKSRKKASTRQQINIKGVKDNILLLPGKQYRAVIEVSPVNFELKSDEEQDALIDTYESFLDSLPCPLEIIVRIRKLDMDKYLSDIQELLTEEEEPVYRSQIENYTESVQGLVRDNKILSRHFYVVLPHSASDFETAKEQLLLNADMVSKGLMRLGMQTRQLTNIELLDLFHAFYNSDQAKHQPISDQVAELINNSYIKKERT